MEVLAQIVLDPGKYLSTIEKQMSLPKICIKQANSGISGISNKSGISDESKSV